jgi:GrpB-like predicted nucleotidyltransferase (UPF0157 family)
MLGLESGVVRLSPYQPTWQRLFEEEKEQLQQAVGRYVLDIQHVGSTSIPGLAAKPILDIAVAVHNFEAATVCIGPIERLGYAYRGEFGIPRRHYFTKGEPRTHHLHMNEIDSVDYENQILFRDYLIGHPDVAQAYAELKLDLARRFAAGRDAYLAGKAPFIEHILALARAARKDVTGAVPA